VLDFMRRAAARLPTLQRWLRQACVTEAAACALASLAAREGVGGASDLIAATNLNRFACKHSDAFAGGKR
jgi:hypothetical protein